MIGRGCSCDLAVGGVPLVCLRALGAPDVYKGRLDELDLCCRGRVEDRIPGPRNEIVYMDVIPMQIIVEVGQYVLEMSEKPGGGPPIGLPIGRR